MIRMINFDRFSLLWRFYAHYYFFYYIFINLRMLLQENILTGTEFLYTGARSSISNAKDETVASDRRNGNKNCCSSILFYFKIFNIFFLLIGCNFFDNWIINKLNELIINYWKAPVISCLKSIWIHFGSCLGSPIRIPFLTIRSRFRHKESSKNPPGYLSKFLYGKAVLKLLIYYTCKYERWSAWKIMMNGRASIRSVAKLTRRNCFCRTKTRARRPWSVLSRWPFPVIVALLPLFAITESIIMFPLLSFLYLTFFGFEYSP